MRFASASVVLVIVAASACAPRATSPRPLPPPRAVAYEQPATPPVQRPADLPVPATAPLVDERYLHWTLPVDLLAVIPLTYFLVRPDDYYLAAPSLLLPPLIHIAHGNSESAAISFAMRVAMVGGVYLAGRHAENECNNSDSFLCFPIQSLIIAEVVMLTPIMVDSFFLARRTRSDDGWSRLPIMPTVAPVPGGGVSFGAASRF